MWAQQSTANQEGNGDCPPTPRKAACKIKELLLESHQLSSSARTMAVTLHLVRRTSVPVLLLPSLFPVTGRKIKASMRFLHVLLTGKELLVTINIVFVLQQSLFSWARSLCATLAFHLKPSVLKSNAWTNADSCIDPKVL